MFLQQQKLKNQGNVFIIIADMQRVLELWRLIYLILEAGILIQNKFSLSYV